MNTDTYIIIDFDSTFTKVEALDELAKISFINNYKKQTYNANIHANNTNIQNNNTNIYDNNINIQNNNTNIYDNIDNIQIYIDKIRFYTDLAMEGKMSIQKSLHNRIQLLDAHKTDIDVLIQKLQKKVSDSFIRNKNFLKLYANKILIVSGGFKEFILPIVIEYGILPENVYANTFLFDNEDKIIGYDTQNVLSQSKGKVKLLQELNLQGEVYVIGDGYTDYEIKEAGLAHKFYAFAENIDREAVTQKADHIIPNLDEFLFLNNLKMTVSYPKHRISVLLLENIHPKAVELFKAEGYQVETIKGALSEEELSEKIKEVSILGIRSKTELTAKVLANAHKLLAVGAFCIGTNQIDIQTCMQKGVSVFNAPYSNTRSVVELALGEMILLIRNVIDKSNKMHKGIWDKSAKNSFEIRGKKLGIIGYGNIGSQLSVLAEALGMKVYFYDVVDKLSLGNAIKCNTLEELLNVSDIVSLHVDGRVENEELISEKQFQQMKDGVIFMNLSRGSVVNIKDLVNNIKKGKIIGTAIDVFPEEPKTNDDEFLSELRELPNVLLTPHVGGSTEEAQENIANYVPTKLMDYINTGGTFASVNMPNLQLPAQKDAHRLLHIHKNTSGILAKINLVLAQHNINILGQYLKTNEEIGYVITDIDQEYDKEVINDLKSIEHTIKFRVLY
jgi:D-3-phosphoglycerate dehydrogenase / 2-oxoglutarate reductase